MGNEQHYAWTKKIAMVRVFLLIYSTSFTVSYCLEVNIECMGGTQLACTNTDSSQLILLVHNVLISMVRLAYRYCMILPIQVFLQLLTVDLYAWLATGSIQTEATLKHGENNKALASCISCNNFKQK